MESNAFFCSQQRLTFSLSFLFRSSQLEALRLLTPKQAAELLLLDLPSLPGEDVVINEVFDYLTEPLQQQKIPEFLFHLIMFLERVKLPTFFLHSSVCISTSIFIFVFSISRGTFPAYRTEHCEFISIYFCCSFRVPSVIIFITTL